VINVFIHNNTQGKEKWLHSKPAQRLFSLQQSLSASSMKRKFKISMLDVLSAAAPSAYEQYTHWSPSPLSPHMEFLVAADFLSFAPLLLLLEQTLMAPGRVFLAMGSAQHRWEEEEEEEEEEQQQQQQQSSSPWRQTPPAWDGAPLALHLDSYSFDLHRRMPCVSFPG